MDQSTAHEFLRHTLATLAYRGAKTLRDAPESFAAYRAADGTRTPAGILAHIGDLFDWALSMASGSPPWNNSDPLAWDEEKQRFFAALRAFDAFLASGEPLHAEIERLFQGPVADALTHVGQLAMLRRLAGSPTVGENFYIAAVEVGQVSADQPPPVQPFK